MLTDLFRRIVLDLERVQSLFLLYKKGRERRWLHLVSANSNGHLNTLQEGATIWKIELPDTVKPLYSEPLYNDNYDTMMVFQFNISFPSLSLVKGTSIQRILYNDDFFNQQNVYLL